MQNCGKGHLSRLLLTLWYIDITMQAVISAGKILMWPDTFVSAIMMSPKKYSITAPRNEPIIPRTSTSQKFPTKSLL